MSLYPSSKLRSDVLLDMIDTVSMIGVVEPVVDRSGDALLSVGYDGDSLAVHRGIG